MDEENAAKTDNYIDYGEYRVKRAYGKESLDECLLKIVRLKISQVLQQEENIVT